VATLYFYIDETFREAGDYWHCNIGGALLENERIVDAEIALEEVIYTLAMSEGLPYSQGEFKYTDFFRATSDEFKFKLMTELTGVVAAHGIRFLVSHAKLHKRHINSISFGSAQLTIQHLAYSKHQ
jgi:hypothetical protein